MPCYLPIKGYVSQERNPSGKRSLVLRAREGFQDRHLDVPCGQCLGCLKSRARDWSLRIEHEAQMHESNYFVTLTYDDEHLPEYDSLNPRDMELFLHRLRKKYGAVRYFQVGEYGERRGRPHHHVVLFGVEFDDMHYVRQRGEHRVFESETLEKLWAKGLTEIGSVTPESAGYVAGYVTKGFRGKNREETERYYYPRVPPYATMSRRPGLGESWFKKYHPDVMARDSVIQNGREVKLPRYYDKLSQRMFPERHRKNKALRKKRIPAYSETSDVRLDQKKKVVASRDALFRRETL